MKRKLRPPGMPELIKEKPKPKKAPLEKVVEKYYKDEIVKRGGISYKFQSQHQRSVTDQITIINGRVIFVEVKRVGGVISAKQKQFRDRVVRNGAEHCFVEGHDGVNTMLMMLDVSDEKFTGEHFK